MNNAGTFIPGNSQQLEVDTWDRIMGINLRALFLTTKFALPHLKESQAGRIIRVKSQNSHL